MKHTVTQALVTIAIAAAIVVAVKVVQARAMEPKQEYWLPQEGTNLTTTIAGDWCMFSETKANPRVPSGRSQHYKPPQPGCSGVTVSGNSFNWTNGLTCTATHVNKWWKNAESWSAWRVSATCQSTRVSPTQYEFEFIHADPGLRPAGCLQSEGCEWWPSLIISTAPFIPDSVRNVGVSPPADSTPKSEAKPKDKDEEPPPPTPQIGERVTTEFFDYVRKKRGFDCQQAIKRHAEYGIRSPGALYGTNSGDSVFFHLRFSRKSRTVDGDGNMDLAGDEAEAQNGIGNWVGVKYLCTVNVRTLEVRDTMLTRGRFVD